MEETIENTEYILEELSEQVLQTTVIEEYVPRRTAVKKRLIKKKNRNRKCGRRQKT